MVETLTKSFEQSKRNNAVRMAREAAIDARLKDIAAEHETDLDLLILAVQRTLVKKYAWIFAQPSFFNDASIDRVSADDQTLDDVHFIAKWLRAEVDRNAAWLSKCDVVGRPKVLVRSDLESLCNFAKRQQRKYGPGKKKTLHLFDNRDDDPAEHFHMDDETRKAWPLFSSDSPEKFFREMTEGLLKGTQLHLVLYPDGDLKSITYNYNFNSHFDRGEEFYSFQRHFSNGRAFHAGASVSGNLQGKGIGKIVNAHLFELYKKIGIKDINIAADFIGAYAWARLGFVPTQKSWDEIKESIGKRLDFIEAHPSQKDGPLPSRYVDILRKALAADDPKSLWFIVDQETSYYGTTLGKLLTLPLDILPKSFPKEKSQRISWGLKNFIWSGLLDMQDPDCVIRFKAYLYADKKPGPVFQKKPAILGVTR